MNGRERTYSSAIALRDWFREHNTPVDNINVLTEGDTVYAFLLKEISRTIGAKDGPLAARRDVAAVW